VATTFGDTAAPAAYIANLKAYFAQLSFVGDGSISSQALTAADVVPPSSSWFPGLIFAVTGRYRQSVRFLQHGLRVPDPADPNFPPTLPLRGLFDLTGQQFDVTGGILTATIAATAPKFTVALVGAGVASLLFVLDVGPEQGPLWTPGILDRIRNVPRSFMLRQGVIRAQFPYELCD
jgi:hypothetical protein